MANELTNKIKERYGSLKHFCKENNINYSTYSNVVNNSRKSSRIVAILVEKGFIKDEKDLMKNQAKGGESA